MKKTMQERKVVPPEEEEDRMKQMFETPENENHFNFIILVFTSIRNSLGSSLMGGYDTSFGTIRRTSCSNT